MVYRGKRRIFVPKGGGIGGTCQGGHTGVSFQKEKESGTCQWFIGEHKEFHSKKRRNRRYASEKGLVGVSFRKEKEWAVRVKRRLVLKRRLMMI